MHDEFTPLLTTTDWNEEWKELQKVRRHADDAAVSYTHLTLPTNREV